MLNFCVAATVKDFGAGDIASTVIVGMLIVFAVLAIIYLCLVVMERAFRPDAKDKTVVVESPLAGRVSRIVSGGAVKKSETVLELATADGDAAILAPKKGRANLAVQTGDTVAKGDTLFTME